MQLTSAVQFIRIKQCQEWWVVVLCTSRQRQQTFGLVVVQHSSVPLQKCHHLAMFVPDSIHDRGAIVPATSDAIAACSLQCIDQLCIVRCHTCLLQPELKFTAGVRQTGNNDAVRQYAQTDCMVRCSCLMNKIQRADLSSTFMLAPWMRTRCRTMAIWPLLAARCRAVR